MKPSHVWLSIIVVLALVRCSFGSDTIPQAAWHRPIGLPLENPGGKKPEIKDMIDDGYWQGAPVGGLGAGTFFRSYRGEFELLPLTTRVPNYPSVPANPFNALDK